MRSFIGDIASILGFLLSIFLLIVGSKLKNSLQQQKDYMWFKNNQRNVLKKVGEYEKSLESLTNTIGINKITKSDKVQIKKTLVACRAYIESIKNSFRNEKELFSDIEQVVKIIRKKEMFFNNYKSKDINDVVFLLVGIRTKLETFSNKK